MNKKRGQITIFIILGIILISAVVLFFLFREQTTIDTTGKPDENPESFMNSCLEGKIKNAINYLSLRGGYVNNSLNLNFKFENEPPIDITYLCYNQNSYLRCINQKPLFTQDLKTEIKKYISEDVENCFNEMTDGFVQKGYGVETNYRDFSVDFIPKRVIIQTDSDITLTVSGESVKEENFKITVASRYYEIVTLVQELVNEEAEFCYTENLGINLVYPEFIVDKFRTQESIVYTVEHKESKEKFRFVVRGCVIPPGF